MEHDGCFIYKFSYFICLKRNLSYFCDKQKITIDAF
jgi:hypothetical protein